MKIPSMIGNFCSFFFVGTSISVLYFELYSLLYISVLLEHTNLELFDLPGELNTLSLLSDPLYHW